MGAAVLMMEEERYFAVVVFSCLQYIVGLVSVTAKKTNEILSVSDIL